MREDDARALELVRAVEMEDPDGILLTREDRLQADAAARQASASLKGTKADRTYLGTRAGFAVSRLQTRHPGIARLLARSRWPSWIGILLPLAALVAGIAANELGSGRRMDLLAVPLLGTIIWNLLFYLSLPIAAMRRIGMPHRHPISRLVAWLAGVTRRDFDRGSALHRAAGNFERRWSELAARVNGARIARTLHLSAALFAAGIISGIYLRALVVEYRAGWESTFLGPDAVHALLAAVLGPASALTGVDIPPASAMPSLRWSSGDGMIAGPWIHLWTATLAGAVVLPRIALSIWQGLRAARLSRAMPVAGREDFYTRRLLRAAGGEAGRVRITPYAYTVDDISSGALKTALVTVLGDGATISADEPIAYGEEDVWLAAHPPDPAMDYRILLFTISATPEDENHGAMASGLAQMLQQEAGGTVLTAILDEGPFRQRFAGQAGFNDRLEGRIDQWRSVLSASGLTPLTMDLSQGDGSHIAEQLEGGLLSGAELR